MNQSGRGKLSRLTALLSALLFVSPLAAAQEKVGETRISLAEARTVWVVPTLSLSRQYLTYGDANVNPGNELATGLDLGARLISSSNRDRTLLVGLDLRQDFCQVAGRGSFGLSETKLGVRLEAHPRWKFEPGFSLGWYFGDTIVAKHIDRQFNGNTLSLAVSGKVNDTIRVLAEVSAGNYNEGPGFIFLARRPGIESLNVKSFNIGIEWPIEFISPTWIQWSDGR